MVSGSLDTTIRVWDLGTGLQVDCLQVLFSHIFSAINPGPLAGCGQSRHVAGPRQPKPRPLRRQGGQSELPQPRDLSVHQARALGEARHGQVQVLSQK